MMKILVILVAMMASGCSLMRYSHTTAAGETRSFIALALGATTAVKDAQWKVGDSDLHIGETQQTQPLGEILGQVAGAAVKAAK